MAQEKARQTAKPERLYRRQRQPQLKCPQCGSTRLYKDGLRYLKDGGPVQRWLCRTCSYRFSDPNSNHKKSCNGSGFSQHVQRIHRLNLKTLDALSYSCQVCARRQSEAKNLVEVEPLKERLAGATARRGEAFNLKMYRHRSPIRNYTNNP